MVDVDRNGQQISLFACEEWGEQPEWLDAAEAREVARRLIDHADAADAELAAARAACECEGHDWDGFNAYHASAEVYVEYCCRDLCDARRETDGWREKTP